MPPLSAFIAHDLIQSSHVHATRHFIIESDDDKVAPLSLWLFLDCFDVALMPFEHLARLADWQEHGETSTPAPSVRVFQAAKVMFRPSGPHDVNQADQSWTSPSMVDRLSYPGEVCERLKLMLESSNQSYPPSQRTLITGSSTDAQADNRIWRTGFLPLC